MKNLGDESIKSGGPDDGVGDLPVEEVVAVREAVLVPADTARKLSLRESEVATVQLRCGLTDQKNVNCPDMIPPIWPIKPWIQSHL